MNILDLIGAIVILAGKKEMLFIQVWYERKILVVDSLEGKGIGSCIILPQIELRTNFSPCQLFCTHDVVPSFRLDYVEEFEEVDLLSIHSRG